MLLVLEDSLLFILFEYKKLKAGALSALSVCRKAVGLTEKKNFATII